MNDIFKKYSIIKKTKYGYKCYCVKGLWGVMAPTRKQAIGAGFYYFVQYYTGGEYDADEGVSKFIERLNNEKYY